MGPDGGPYIAINENSGNIELEDNTGTTVAIWDDTNSQWDFQNNPISNVDSLTSNSVNTNDGSINGLAFGRGFDQDTVGDVTSRNIDKLSIAGDSYGTIFSVASPVDIIGGSAFGQGGDRWRITWEDDSTDVLSVGLARSQLADEDIMVTPLPSVEGVKKLELFNQLGGPRSYGAVVFTT